MTTRLSSAVSQLAFRHVALASAVVLLLATVVVLGPPGSQHCSGQEVNPGDNLVALVNGTEDATFCISAGTYHIGPSVLEPGNGDELIGDPVTTTAEGAISAPTKIIGSGSVVISLRGAENVLIENLDVSGAMSDGRDRFIDRSSGSGIHGGINTTLRHVVSHHNARSGIKKFNGVADQVEVHNNGSEFFLGVGASGIKSNRDFVVRNSYIHNNIGVGVWADFRSSSLEVTDSVVVSNGLSGVRWQHREEAQGEALIARNVIQNNNFLGHAGAGGVSIASASNADIGHNTFGGNAGDAVTIEGQKGLVRGINIHDNVLGGTADAPVTLDALSVCALDGVTCTNNVETAGPTATPSPTESPIASPSPSASPSTSPSPAPSESPVPTPSPSPSGSPAPSPSPSPAPGAGGPGVTIAAAGDICKPDGIDCKKTSDLIVNDSSIDAVLTLGDNQYENGELQNFQNAFDPTWGRFKDKIYPSPGNHDPYNSGYKDYFGKPQFYSADVGNWHIVSLDSNEVQQSAAFLSQDLQQDSHQCEIVFWHHARFSSGENHGSNASMAPLWEIMAANGVDVNLVGHDHIYERFAPQSSAGAPDPNGVRQFTVGTGGDDLRGAASPIANSEFIKSGTYGVIKMALSDGGYSWEFVDVSGQSHDSGSGTCHP